MMSLLRKLLASLGISRSLLFQVLSIHHVQSLDIAYFAHLRRSRSLGRFNQGRTLWLDQLRENPVSCISCFDIKLSKSEYPQSSFFIILWGPVSCIAPLRGDYSCGPVMMAERMFSVAFLRFQFDFSGKIFAYLLIPTVMQLGFFCFFSLGFLYH